MSKRPNSPSVLENRDINDQKTHTGASVDHFSSIESSNRELNIAEQYLTDIAQLESELKNLENNYQGMLEREKRYLQSIDSLQEQLAKRQTSGVSRQELLKVQTNYEGLLAREERYLREIKQLQEQVLEQKNSLYRTYSYRLGYLLIHSTKSFKNFFNLPGELIRLYRDNKQRKNLKLRTVDRGVESTQKVLQAETIKRAYVPIEESEIEAGRQQVKIATIMDEFTSLCFAPEAETLQITPESFEEELAEFKPDFLFIESAWQGKDGLWKLKISQQAEELFALIEYCRTHQIKTLFWNKEDPVHFGTFIEVAKLVDVVFTTDIDCIQKYKAIVQHDAVYLMPFAAQPKVHNPIELYERIDKFNFAGSYYLKYPVRQRDFAVLSDVAIKSRGLDIYDRNFNNDHPHYQFPERYQPLILGSLPPEEIDKAYKGYEFGINMNTIKQSQTMFARRVFEMLASNTIVLSNYSRGVRLLFGDLVVCSDNQTELQRQVDQILETPITRKKFKLQGLRSVLSQHTYEHRLNYILQKLKIRRAEASIENHVVVFSKCETAAEIDYVVSQFTQQTAAHKTLIIESNIAAKSSNNIHYVKDDQAALTLLKGIAATHVTIFNKADYYGANYLTDMLLSYHYLQYHDAVPVTKNSYYSYSQGELLERNGLEYQFVSSYATARTLYPQEAFMRLVDKYSLSDLLAGLLVKGSAFSIDNLSYLQNGQVADEGSIKQICEDLTLDSGVSLSQHLLPIAEAITFSGNADPLEKRVRVNPSLVKESLRKEITFSAKKKRLNLESKMPADQHRLIPLSEPVEIDQWNRMKLKSDWQTKGDVLLVVEFLDATQKQLTHITAIPSPSLTFEIPEGTVFGKISIRIKGVATVGLNSDMSLLLENVARTPESQTYDSDEIATFTNDDIDRELVRPKSKQIQINNRADGLEISSTLAADKHAYIYFRTIYTREEVNLALNSVFETLGSISGMDLRTVFLFLDAEKEKLAHSIIKVDNHSHAMAIPEECRYIRIGFKVTGSGTANLQSIKIGEIRERVQNFIGKSDTLVVAKQYPSYDDLYRYGFLHSRLRAYKKSDVIVDMFKIAARGQFGFSEFESIDVFTGDAENLKQALESGQFKRVFVHILDKNMWSILEAFVDQIEIVIWVHGAEAQVWQRRAYEFEGMTNEEISRRKKLSDQRKAFWQSLISKQYKNVKLIFVSEYFKNEFVTDICSGEESFNYEIIHNYIDSELFPYQEKSAEDAYKVLSIRPFSSLTYANDLTVKAILELSKTPDFDRFQFTIVGDGPLFDTTVEPLRAFKNVTLRKEFLTQPEIAKLHQEHGVFLVPTRMDTQGVSRGEAMSSGLVAVTTDVAAVSEFIDSDSGIVVEAEAYQALAEGLSFLIKNSQEFRDYSCKGFTRVTNQCAIERTISKELELMNV